MHAHVNSGELIEVAPRWFSDKNGFRRTGAVFAGQRRFTQALPGRGIPEVGERVSLPCAGFLMAAFMRLAEPRLLSARLTDPVTKFRENIKGLAGASHAPVRTFQGAARICRYCSARASPVGSPGSRVKLPPLKPRLVPHPVVTRIPADPSRTALGTQRLKG
jgi:hypothetical protein